MGQYQEQMIVGWSQDEKRVTDAAEDYFEKSAQDPVEIDLVESLLRPENLEVSLRYVLKHANYGGGQYLPALGHNSESRITSLQAEDDGGKVR